MYDIIKKLVSQAIKSKIFDEKSLNRLKNDFCEKYKITSPKNTDLIEAYRELLRRHTIKPNEKFFELIKKRKVRSLSGIASITVITKDYPCPGKCIFCPKEKGMPKSYLSNEPAIMRAILNKFDPFSQTRTRLTSLQKTGHPVSKIEMIIAGGTFSYYPRKYTAEFVKRIYDALNYPKKSRNLISAQKINEIARHRCIGLSIETRPDFINEKEIKYLRELGVTKVELGVQTTYNDVLKFNKRGHDIMASIKAIRLLKDAGFKVNFHIMPGLPHSTIAKDLCMFKELFSNPDFQPDWLKIYPCVVVPGSQLEKIWRNGKYKPYTDKQIISLLVKAKPMIPEYVRITRLYRDIPSNSILAGPKISNLREYVQKEMLKKGLKCRCIRCREIKNMAVDAQNLELRIQRYEASGGLEYFLSFDDVKHDKLCSLLRLRFPSNFFKYAGRTTQRHFLPELNNCAIIRELHTYGLQIPVFRKGESAIQHLGLGRRLLAEAENLAHNAGFRKIAVISGIGARDYYKKFGYKLSKMGYMIKSLDF